MKNQIAIGNIVKFDTEHGPQTGTVRGLIPNAAHPTAAIIDVDHTLEGAMWTIPVNDLSIVDAA